MDIPENMEPKPRSYEEQVQIVISFQDWLYDTLGPSGTVLDLLLITRTIIAKMRHALYPEEVNRAMLEASKIVERELLERKDSLGIILAEDWREIEGGYLIANALNNEIPDTVPEDLLDETT